MLIYVESNALVKRSLQETESGLLVDTLEAQVESGARLFSSSLGTIETTRIIRQRLDQMDPFTVVDLIGAALSGVIEYPITSRSPASPHGSGRSPFEAWTRSTSRRRPS